MLLFELNSQTNTHQYPFLSCPVIGAHPVTDYLVKRCGHCLCFLVSNVRPQSPTDTDGTTTQLTTYDWCDQVGFIWVLMFLPTSQK